MSVNAARRLSRWQRLSITCATVGSLVLAATAAFGTSRPSAPAQQGTTSVSVSAAAPLADAPPIASLRNIYADAGPNMLNATTRRDPYRIYVPNSGGSSVDVIDPRTMQIVAHYSTGTNPQHVVPSWDMKTLYVTNDLANSLTPVDPRTGLPAGPNIPVDDPYNMYFTPNGRYAIVVAEARQHLDFRDPHSFVLRHRLKVSCPGIDHMDFSANGGYALASCEFSAQLVKVNLHTMTVAGYLHLPGSSPQDVKLDPTGRVFYVADRYRGGIWLVDGAHLRILGFIRTGRDAHGLYPSRDGRYLYITNRLGGSVTVLDVASGRKVATWHIPGYATPDMGGLSPDGAVFWLAGRYSSAVYAISTHDGHLIAKITVGLQPHGVCVWPQPGRYSLGHTGVTR